MREIIKHTILSSGYHVLHTKKKDSNVIRIDVFTELEHQEFSWWQIVLLKFNLVAGD